MMMIPKSIVKKALELKASVGREYDSQGKHITYWYQAAPNWRVYRGTVGGMLAVLRQVKLNQA